jgi:hypothetical protein
MPIDELSSRTVLTFKEDLTMCVTIAFDEYDSICAAWGEGKRFWEGRDEWGDYTKIDLTGLASIGQQSGENRRRNLEDQAIARKIQDPII